MNPLEKVVLVTVGSTRFDMLVNRMLSPDVIAALERECYTSLILQIGESVLDRESSSIQRASRLNITTYKFKPSLEEEYRKASLVVSHAGTYFTVISSHLLSHLTL